MLTPYAKVLASVGGGANTSGGLTVTAGQSLALSGENTTGWQNQRWEFFEYPNGWTAPAGWSTDGSGTIYSTAVTPPSFSFPAISLWGKYLLRLTVNGGLLAGALAPFGSVQQLIDTGTAFRMLSSRGLDDTGFGEANQFDAARQWAAAQKANWRTIESILASATLRASVTKSANYTMKSTDGDAFAVLGGGPVVFSLPGPSDGTAPITDESHAFIDRDYAASVTNYMQIDGRGNNIRQRDGTSAAKFTSTIPGDAPEFRWNGTFWSLR